MDFTFGGKYRLEEELAIGGCGPSSIIIICRRVVIDSYRYRNRLLWSAQSGRERSGHQARTSGRQTAESAEARVEDIQDADGWTGRTVDDLVWQARGLQCDGNRSARSLAGRPLQTVQSPVFPQDRSAHS